MEKFILFETFVWAKLVKCTINSAFCNVLARHFKLLIRKMLISFVQKNPVNSVYTFGKVLLVVTMFQIDSPYYTSENGYEQYLHASVKIHKSKYFIVIKNELL